jgi:hypothetical protein
MVVEYQQQIPEHRLLRRNPFIVPNAIRLTTYHLLLCHEHQKKIKSTYRGPYGAAK